MKGWHVTTDKKLERYVQTGGILSPVRFWSNEQSARAWMVHTGRNRLLEIELPEEKTYPLPDHRPIGHAWWHNGMIRTWKDVTVVPMTKEDYDRSPIATVYGGAADLPQVVAAMEDAPIDPNVFEREVFVGVGNSYDPIVTDADGITRFTNSPIRRFSESHAGALFAMASRRR